MRFNCADRPEVGPCLAVLLRFNCGSWAGPPGGRSLPCGSFAVQLRGPPGGRSLPWLLRRGEGGADVADEDGGAEFERDAEFVVGEPEGCGAFEFFIGLEFKGVTVDFVHRDAEVDGGLFVVHHVIGDVDADEVGCAERVGDECDAVAFVEFLAADEEHGREEVVDGGVGEGFGLGGDGSLAEVASGFGVIGFGRGEDGFGFGGFAFVFFRGVEALSGEVDGVDFRPE